MESGSEFVGYWGPIIAAAALLLGAMVGWLLLNWGRKIVRPRPTVNKIKTYACGEEAKPEEVHFDSEQFFSPIRRVFRPFYRFVRPVYSRIKRIPLLGDRRADRDSRRNRARAEVSSWG